MPTEQTNQRTEALEKLLEAFEFFHKMYEPSSFQQSDIHFSTEEIFQQMQSIYPSPFYWASDVYDLMNDHNYKMDAIAPGRIEWTMKQRNK